MAVLKNTSTKPKPLLHPTASNAAKAGTGGLYSPQKKQAALIPASGAIGVVQQPAPKPVTMPTTPATLKIGDSMAGGYTFAGYVMRDGKYVPTVKTKNGTAIHPNWQKGKTAKPSTGTGGLGVVKPGTQRPVGSVKPPSTTPTSITTPAGSTTPTTPTLPVAPSHIGNLFPSIGINGITTNPLGAISGTWNPSWDTQLAEWKAASSVDPEYASNYSRLLLQAMEDISKHQAEVEGLIGKDPTTGRTRFQQELLNANNQRDRSVSQSYGNAAARGITSSGMNNNNLANIAEAYIPVINQLNQTYGDARLGSISQAVAQRLLGLNMSLKDAYDAAVYRKINGLPQLGVEG